MILQGTHELISAPLNDPPGEEENPELSGAKSHIGKVPIHIFIQEIPPEH